VIDSVWACAKDSKGDNIHQTCANAVETIMKTAISKRTVDNITVVMIGFSSFKYLLFPKRADLICNNSLDNMFDYKKMQEIHNNNSFDVGTHEFSLELGLLNRNNSKNNQENKKNNLIRKKITTTVSVCGVNAGNKGKNEGSLEKNKGGKNGILTGNGARMSVKKTEGNLNSQRTAYKGLEKKK